MDHVPADEPVTFTQTFLGALLALVVFAAAKWTLLGPVFGWWMRRSIGRPEIDPAEFSPAAMHARFEEARDQERRQLAAEIARVLREENHP